MELGQAGQGIDDIKRRDAKKEVKDGSQASLDDNRDTAKSVEGPATKKIKLEDSKNEEASNVGHAGDKYKAAVASTDSSMLNAEAGPSSPSAGRSARGSDRKSNRGRRQNNGGDARSKHGGQDDKKKQWQRREINSNGYKGNQSKSSDAANETKGSVANGKGKQRDDGSDAENNPDGTARLPKKKIAMLVGYSGLGYSGSQINPGVKTIESEVFEACVRAGCVSEANADNPNKIGLMRAARTDAGVSAAVNVLNMKLILQPASMQEGVSIEDHINTFLPTAIRVWKVTRVQGGFHSRTMCDSRMYNYSLPTYTFLEPRDGTLMGNRVTWATEEQKANSYWQQHPPAHASVAAGTVPTEVDPTVDTPAVDGEAVPAEGQKALSAFATDQVLRKQFRMPQVTLQALRKTMQSYLGSHNFWNFTVGKDFQDRSCQRIMKRLEVTEPFMVNDTEWISLRFHGQSFMLHQIRKMTALIVLMVRTHTPASLIPETFGPARLNIPKAPALGLLLEQPFFDSYNRKIGDVNRRNASSAKRKQGDTATDASSEGIEEVTIIGAEERIADFKLNTVFAAMYEEEAKDDTYAKWINLHDSQLGSDFDYLNAKGIIPASAVISKKKLEKDEKTVGASATTFIMAKDASGDDEDDTELLERYSGKAAADLEG